MAVLLTQFEMMTPSHDLSDSLMFRTFYYLSTNTEALLTGRELVEYHGPSGYSEAEPRGGVPPEMAKRQNTPLVQTFCGHLPNAATLGHLSITCDWIYPFLEEDYFTMLLGMLGFVGAALV